MRFARFLTLALLSAAIVAGCADASAGLDVSPGAVGHTTAEQRRFR